MKKLTYLLFTVVCCLFVFACTTQKKRGEVSGLKKLYHNTTAEYNGYFNANVLLEETLAKLNTQHEDNYTRVLDLFPYSAVKETASINPDMDKAIEKVSVVIALHRVSDWTDDSYLMMGQAQYLKRDYESAEETLEYMTDEFNPDKSAQRKSKSRTKQSKKAQQKAQKEKQKEKEDIREEKADARKDAAKAKKKEQERIKKEKKRLANDRARAKKKGKPVPKSTPKPEPKTEQTPAPQAVVPTTIPAKPEEVKPDPDSYRFKHRPCFQEGVLWLARTYIERQNYEDAWKLLTVLDKDPKTFNDVRRDMTQVQAYYFLKQKQYEKALPYLEKSLKLIKKKRDRARIAYIIAQVKQLQNNGGEAYAAFEKVLNLNPTYEMEFNTRLNMVLNAWLSGRGSAASAIEDLAKMSKDTKNKEFLDQIYFTMANISLKNNERAEAMGYLRQSLDNSSGNQAQKAEAYYLLARLFHGEENYVSAKNYYDSTLTAMSSTDDRFEDVSKYAANLADIAKNISIITLQDSLIRIANMSDKEKREVAKRLLEAQSKAKEAAAAAAAPRPTSPIPGQNRFAAPGAAKMPALQAGVGTGGAKPSTFFAYGDQTQLRRQQRDFEKKWGDRSNEDDWRRSNKRSSSGEITALTADTSSEVADVDMTSILKDVPNSPDQLVAANKKIEEALFTLGTLFYDRIQNYTKATGTHENLLTRYPETKHELQTWYYLYLAYTATPNAAMAKIYYDKIAAKYPTSTYARVLLDPDFARKSREDENKLTRYYDETYRLFIAGQTKTAVDRINSAEKEFGAKNEFTAKFALLRAMCMGKLQSKEVYIAELKSVVATFPNTPEQKRAKEMLRVLDGGKSDPEETGIRPGGVASTETTTSIYRDEPEKVHYGIVVMQGKSISLDKAKADVADFNRLYFKVEDLKVSNIFLGSDTNMPVLVIRKFATKADAQRYYEAAEGDREAYLTIANLSYEVFVISQDNYRELLRTRNLDEYRTFFEKAFLDGE